MSLLKGLPVEHFRCVLADPPWDFRANSIAKPGRNPRRHYDVMSLDDIAALPVKQVAADDCLLWFWITGPFLARGAHLPIFEAWGFEPSGMGFVWIKLNPKAPQLIFMTQDVAWGPGMTTRKNAEFCILGKRGSVPRLSASVHEVIIAPRREHSRKPDEAHERIEKYCDGPRLELFGRQLRPNWTVVGNQADKFPPESPTNGSGEAMIISAPSLEGEKINAPTATAANLGPSSRQLLAKLQSGMRKLPVPRITQS